MTVERLADALKGRPQGCFVVFEGGDGSGKTTHLQRLGAELAAAGAPVLTTREPGGTPIGRQLRELILSEDSDISARTEALLYAADRAHHVHSTIRPAIVEGTTVISDRYIDSSVAYQAAGRGLDPTQVRDLSMWATGGLEPDVVIVMDLDPQVAVERRGGNRDRMEKAGEDFHQSVFQFYRDRAAAHPERYHLIDANQPPEDVYGDLVGTLVEALT